MTVSFDHYSAIIRRACRGPAGGRTPFFPASVDRGIESRTRPSPPPSPPPAIAISTATATSSSRAAPSRRGRRGCRGFGGGGTGGVSRLRQGAAAAAAEVRRKRRLTNLRLAPAPVAEARPPRSHLEGGGGRGGGRRSRRRAVRAGRGQGMLRRLRRAVGGPCGRAAESGLPCPSAAAAEGGLCRRRGAAMTGESGAEAAVEGAAGCRGTGPMRIQAL